jgi:hypothetical protein
LTTPALKDGDSSRHRLGFLFHSRLHPGGPGMADISSAGSHRSTSGQNVLRGVEVPVVPGAAGRASPSPNGKAQVGQQVPAPRAGLSGGVPAVGDLGFGLGPVRRPVAAAGQPPLIAGQVAGAAGLEPRVAGAPGEERGKRLVLMTQRLLQRHRRHLGQKHQARVFLHGGQRPVGLRIRGGLGLGGIPLLPHCEGAVPHHPHAPEGAVQHHLLLLVGVCPAPVCRPHMHSMSATTDKTPPRHAGHRIPPRPEDRGFHRRSQ